VPLDDGESAVDSFDARVDAVHGVFDAAAAVVAEFRGALVEFLQPLHDARAGVVPGPLGFTDEVVDEVPDSA
jgi:hypothetical protein